VHLLLCIERATLDPVWRTVSKMEGLMRVRALPGALLLVLTLAESAGEDPASDCKQDSDWRLRISGCTTVIANADEADAAVAWAYTNRGVAYSQTGRSGRVMDDFDQALRLDPNDAYGYMAVEFCSTIMERSTGQLRNTAERSAWLRGWPSLTTTGEVSITTWETTHQPFRTSTRQSNSILPWRLPTTTVAMSISPWATLDGQSRTTARRWNWIRTTRWPMTGAPVLISTSETCRERSRVLTRCSD